MSGLYKKHARPGDVIYSGFPPVDGDPPDFFGTGGDPAKIKLHGVGGDALRGYWASISINDKESRVSETALQSAYFVAIASREIKLPEVPKTGGCPEQGSVMLNFNDISKALNFVKRTLPRRLDAEFFVRGME